MCMAFSNHDKPVLILEKDRVYLLTSIRISTVQHIWRGEVVLAGHHIKKDKEINTLFSK